MEETTKEDAVEETASPVEEVVSSQPQGEARSITEAEFAAAKKPCVECNGTGLQDADHLCPVCHGNGVV